MIRDASHLVTTAFDSAHRMLDLILAGTALLTLAPVLAVRGLLARVTAGRIFDREPVIGMNRVPFERLRFAGNYAGKWLGSLFNIVRGELSWNGPRAFSEEEASTVPPQAWVRFNVRPGLVSSHQLRKRLGLGYEAELEHDSEFFYAQSLRGTLGVVVRALPNAILGGRNSGVTKPRFSIFGVEILNTTMKEALSFIVERAREKKITQICFVNPDCLNIAFRNPAYAEVLRNADWVLPDGIGIHLACRMKGSEMRENVNGTDLFPRLCERLNGSGLSLYFLGAEAGLADCAATAMRNRFPNLCIAGCHEGYFTELEESRLIAEINRSKADILLVGMGVPRQDSWIARHRAELAPAVCIGVGGLFDFYSNRIPRAPEWIRELGLEWTWRLAMEPRRMWQRYLIGNPKFLYRVWQERRPSVSN
jgi:N-acetylglucosaminyldiphosphoundecaprenol N-acetyl-beta-D-mannosaminyltransferase